MFIYPVKGQERHQQGEERAALDCRQMWSLFVAVKIVTNHCTDLQPNGVGRLTSFLFKIHHRPRRSLKIIISFFYARYYGLALPLPRLGE
jgi:hypothetical protein